MIRYENVEIVDLKELFDTIRTDIFYSNDYLLGNHKIEPRYETFMSHDGVLNCNRAIKYIEDELVNKPITHFIDDLSIKKLTRLSQLMFRNDHVLCPVKENLYYLADKSNLRITLINPVPEESSARSKVSVAIWEQDPKNRYLIYADKASYVNELSRSRYDLVSYSPGVSSYSTFYSNTLMPISYIR